MAERKITTWTHRVRLVRIWKWVDQMFSIWYELELSMTADVFSMTYTRDDGEICRNIFFDFECVRNFLKFNGMENYAAHQIELRSVKIASVQHLLNCIFCTRYQKYRIPRFFFCLSWRKKWIWSKLTLCTWNILNILLNSFRFDSKRSS